MTDTKPTVNATMQQFNQLVQVADEMTDYRYDRLSVVELVDKLDHWPSLAREIRRVAIELGVWSH